MLRAFAHGAIILIQISTVNSYKRYWPKRSSRQEDIPTFKVSKALVSPGVLPFMGGGSHFPSVDLIRLSYKKCRHGK